MKLSQLKLKTSDLLILDKKILRNLEPSEDVLSANIKYWLKNRELIALKKGSYILQGQYTKEPQKDLYLEYIANQLLTPSYLSLEYVLAKYQLLTEGVTAMTSITPKTSREIVNDLSAFRYYSISPKLFTGYTVKYFYKAPVLEATKSKALFDYLYLRFLKNKPISKQAIIDLRLNWENISKKEFLSAYSYLKLTRSQRLRKVFNLIKQLYYA